MSNVLLVPPPHQGPPVPYTDQLEMARATLPPTLPREASKIMLALDVDGTLLRPQGASPRVRKVLHEALEAGINVVIATGRGIDSTRPVFTELNLPDGYSVSSNGAQTVHWERRGGADKTQYNPEVLSEHRFHPEEAGRVLLEALPGLLLGIDDGASGMLVNQKFPAGELLSRERVLPAEQLLRSRTPRMVARAPWMSRDDFNVTIRELPLEDVNVAVGWTAWADLCKLGVSKASGLQELADSLGVKANGTVALGDGTNDIEMLSWAGHGVAMGGATDEVRAAADTVTGPVDYDGAAAVVEAVLERV